MKLENGAFTISLDLELYWGVRDKHTLDQYREHLIGERKAIHELLNIFCEYGIHATWAAVGFLFLRNTEQLKENLPHNKPNYSNQKLSSYKYIENNEELEAVFHFAPDVIELIRKNEGQEIGTHTFCHYYCLEEGQTLSDFAEDLDMAVKIAQGDNLSIKSLVFPKNQWNQDYLKVLPPLGVLSYRGTETSWIYQTSKDADQKGFLRGLRFLDSYLNLSGHHTYDFQDCTSKSPFNFPSSRFLRPFSNKLELFEGLRLKRITEAMDDAAVKKKIFHLWWHPHNFGVNTERNIEFLRKILEHYKELQQKYGFSSLNMGELSSCAAGRQE